MAEDKPELKLTREQLPMFADPTLVARYKSCEAHLGEFGKELNIQYINSKQEGKGHARGLVTALLEHCAENGLVLASSVVISPGWAHIAVKYNLKIYEP